jgi:FixJ family two-component response regulator
MHVAIVDDDCSVRNALRRLLGSWNLTPHTFASTAEFLESLNDTRPDCVIADLKMPGVGGLELLRALAEQPAHVPVIIITALDTPQSRSDCQTLGAVAFLTKPFGEEALLSAIGAALDLATEGATEASARRLDQGPMGAIQRPS